jgi:hypothetical protein
MVATIEAGDQVVPVDAGPGGRPLAGPEARFTD